MSASVPDKNLDLPSLSYIVFFYQNKHNVNLKKIQGNCYTRYDAVLHQNIFFLKKRRQKVWSINITTALARLIKTLNTELHNMFQS